MTRRLGAVLGLVALALGGLACESVSDPAAAPADDDLGVWRAEVGEPSNGFPSWAERVIHLWINRGRSDPQTDMTANCTVANIADFSCYTRTTPLVGSYQLNRSARMHSAHQTACGMTHDSRCTLVDTINTLYTPGTCDGSPSCACKSGACTCTAPGCTDTWTRIGMFGGSGSGECVASGGPSVPLTEYYMWICESYNRSACAYDTDPDAQTNGHRWLIFKNSGPAVGSGCAGNYCTLDFGGPAAASNKIIDGVHYPATGTVALRAHWYDTAAPSQALVNIGGTCTAMSLERGIGANGTYLLANQAISGCTHYYFVFKDSGGNTVTYPETGSFGIGCSADWDSSRPALGSGCSCTASCAGKTCGDDGCGGTCPPGCGSNYTCQSGSCVCGTVTCNSACCSAGQSCFQNACCTSACSGKTCGDDSCGGTCPPGCGTGFTCSSGTCSCGTVTCGSACCAAGQACYQNACCSPACGGKSCGADGCGGTCPPGCGTNFTCSSGTCTCGTVTCGAACCAAGQVCYQSACCNPACGGKVCGSDGCGGSCGTCAGSLACDGSGQCGCTGGLSACGTACVNLQNDTSHCGTCDHPCGATEVCAGGGCVLECPAGTQSCSGSCADLATDPSHCGTCDHACPADSTCQASQCVCTVLACGAACCSAGQVCTAGACCSPGCAGKACGPDGCGGSCGTCPGALACDGAGSCGCASGLTVCGTACVNTQSDFQNCGGCDAPCTAPEVCALGGCGSACPSGYEDCSGSCADLATDPTHCGDCATGCGPGATCQSAACLCPSGLSDCPGVGCTDLQTDPANCGVCGRACQGCVQGQCPGPPDDGGAGDDGGAAGDGGARPPFELVSRCGCAATGPGGGAALALLALTLLAVRRRARS
jgi:hypothetical protein